MVAARFLSLPSLGVGEKRSAVRRYNGGTGGGVDVVPMTR